MPVISAPLLAPTKVQSQLNSKVVGIAAARTIFGIRVVAVERKFVPNCSAPDVMTTDHTPTKKPRGAQKYAYNPTGTRSTVIVSTNDPKTNINIVFLRLCSNWVTMPLPISPAVSPSE